MFFCCSTNMPFVLLIRQKMKKWRNGRCLIVTHQFSILKWAKMFVWMPINFKDFKKDHTVGSIGWPIVCPVHQYNPSVNAYYCHQLAHNSFLSFGFLFYCHSLFGTIHWDSIQIKYQYKRFYRYLFCDVFLCIVLHCSLCCIDFESVFFFLLEIIKKKWKVKW